ncbi:hypothetical protein HDU67_004324 [Dinochytrium kinnereticum]|nr:hypothetical protein HDU67_004324 [Dinochytrium kinnereticum]
MAHILSRLFSPRSPTTFLVLLKVLVGLAGSVPLAGFIYLYCTTRWSKIKGIPHPPTKGIWGNSADMKKAYDNRHEYLYGLSKTYGPTWTVTFPNFRGRSTVQTVDPAIVEYVLKTNFENFVKGNRFRSIMKPLLGNGIFAADGDQWRWQRKVSSHIFTGKNFREVVATVFAEDIDNLVKYLRGQAKNHSKVDLHRLFHAFTLDSFGKIALGRDLKSLADPSVQPPFAAAFDSAVSILAPRFFNPIWFINGFFDGSFEKLKADLKIVDEFAAECIAEKRERRRNGVTTGRKDLMDLYMDAEEKEGKVTDQSVRDMVLNMTLAGRDTTAQGLSWAFYVLCSRRDIVEQIRAELDCVLHGKIPNYDEVSQLKYTNAFIMEIQRLYPSVPSESKTCLKADILPGGIHIPKNTMIAWFPYSMGRSESIWGLDALEIKPERWLEGWDGVKDSFTATLRRESPFRWIAFNAGPRTCLGQQMAMVEMVMAVTALVREFEIEAAPDMDVSVARALTLQMKHGLSVFVGFREGWPRC